MIDTRTISVVNPVRVADAATDAHRNLWLAAAADPRRIEWITESSANNCIDNINRAAERAHGQILFYVADDLFPVDQGWDAKICEQLPAGAPCVLSIPDGFRTDDLPTHPAMTREWYLSEGHFFHPDYAQSNGMYCDNDIRESARRAGCFKQAEGFSVDHRTFYRGDRGPSDAQKEMNCSANFQRGLAIFESHWGSWGRVAFGVRATRIDPCFFWSHAKLLLAGRRKGDVHLQPAFDLPHAAACNFLVAQFIDSEADSLLFMDDDMVFEPDALDRLRSSSRQFDVVSGLACNRRPPHHPIVFDGFDEATNRPTIVKDIKGTVPVQYIGLAFTLVHRWVLRGLSEKKATGPFSFEPRLGEDGKFSEDARAIGAKLAVNCDVPVGHRVASTVFWNTAAGIAETR